MDVIRECSQTILGEVSGSGRVRMGTRDYVSNRSDLSDSNPVHCTPPWFSLRVFLDNTHHVDSQTV